MSDEKKIETRTWIVEGVESHTITAEWTPRRWSPPESVVKLDGEIVSQTTFWSRQFRYGVHAFRLDNSQGYHVVLKYDDKSGYVLFIDGQRTASEDERELSLVSAG